MYCGLHVLGHFVRRSHMCWVMRVSGAPYVLGTCGFFRHLGFCMCLGESPYPHPIIHMSLPPVPPAYLHLPGALILS